MTKRSSLPFFISHMDSLGQGVSKVGPKITFIPKTLPGEEGLAYPVSEKKGVVFARIHNLSAESSSRETPECPHFHQCPSCHYLHTSYEQELVFKRQNLEKMLQKIHHPEIEVVPAIRRLEYRNRIQLHYDIRSGSLGMQDVGADRITPIPQCRVVIPEIQAEIENLYADNQWMKMVPKDRPQGHVEIYFLEGKIHRTWNLPYAHGGFTQVFDEMNQILRNRLKTWWGGEQRDLLDLFGGNGNLSKELNYSKRLCVDIYENPQGDDFFSQHLYADDALSKVKKISFEKLSRPDLLIDPPRSGLKNLYEWLEAFRPRRVAYVSCDPHTLVRDISALHGYEIQGLVLLDLFPSTFHFETVIFMSKKE